MDIQSLSFYTCLCQVVRRLGIKKKKEENLPSPLPAPSQYSGNDAVVFFSLEQVLEKFRKKKNLRKIFFALKIFLKKKQTNIISVALY